MKPTDEIIRKRSFDALGNAATATANVTGIAKEWASYFDKRTGECPFVRLSINLNEDGSKQFGMLKRALKLVATARSYSDYSGSVSRLIRNYNELLGVIRTIHEAHPSLMASEKMFADVLSAIAQMGSALMRIDSSPSELNAAVDNLIAAFNPISSAFKEQEDAALGMPTAVLANNDGRNGSEDREREKEAKRQALRLGVGSHGVGKMDEEHVKRCDWIFKALEEYRCQLKQQVEDVRAKPPKLGPPTEDWITAYINAAIFSLKKGKSGKFMPENRKGKEVKPITKRQIRTTLQQALGTTINDIRRIYMDWREGQLKSIHQSVIRTETEHDIREENEHDERKDVDLAGGEHNWGGIEDEEAIFNRNVRMTIGKPKSIWLKKSTASYNKLQKSLKGKTYRFDYRIFIYWIGLRMEAFVKIPRQVNFKDMLGTVNDVETLLETMSRFVK